MDANKNATPSRNAVSAQTIPLQASWFFRRPFYQVLRRIRKKFVGTDDGDGPWDWNSPEAKRSACYLGESASDLIRTRLLDQKPFMAARFGNTEIDTILPYYLRSHGNFLKRSAGFLRGELPYFWWEFNTFRRIVYDSGFFPLNVRLVERFCRLMIDDIKEIDVLASWLNKEKYLAAGMRNPSRIPIDDFFPVTHAEPWSAALEGKVVLVIHPFGATIESQYMAHRRKLFRNPKMLPEFELKTLQAVQTIAGTPPPPGIETWFDALDSMKSAVDRIHFDVAIIGAGAYGLPLAAHVKRLGKKGIHLGGSTQLLFGIKGKRWDDYGVGAGLYNEWWVRPSTQETPGGFRQVENGCYW